MEHVETIFHMLSLLILVISDQKQPQSKYCFSFSVLKIRGMLKYVHSILIQRSTKSNMGLYTDRLYGVM